MTSAKVAEAASLLYEAAGVIDRLSDEARALADPLDVQLNEAAFRIHRALIALDGDRQSGPARTAERRVSRRRTRESPSLTSQARQVRPEAPGRLSVRRDRPEVGAETAAPASASRPLSAGRLAPRARPAEGGDFGSIPALGPPGRSPRGRSAVPATGDLSGLDEGPVARLNHFHDNVIGCIFSSRLLLHGCLEISDQATIIDRIECALSGLDAAVDHLRTAALEALFR